MYHPYTTVVMAQETSANLLSVLGCCTCKTESLNVGRFVRTQKSSVSIWAPQRATAAGPQGHAWHSRNQGNTHFQWVSSLLQPSSTACASERERTDETVGLSFRVFSLNGLPKDAKHVPSRNTWGREEGPRFEFGLSTVSAERHFAKNFRSCSRD